MSISLYRAHVATADVILSMWHLKMITPLQLVHAFNETDSAALLYYIKIAEYRIFQLLTATQK